ncbi:flagellar protein FlaG [Shewanella sp. AC34-MNA-CIBAN-0136]|uniref:flagellar protein FlaG n=1 Tax=Shewanella sp. AC34-MNA-CIBAN-0136 TaxID=3140463 RepID=UPI003318D560
MEINSNTVQLANHPGLSKVDSVLQPIFNKTNIEPAKLDESSLVSIVNDSDSADSAENKVPDEAQLQQVAKDLTDMVAMMQKGLKFSVDDDSGKQVIKVQDIESGDIIRQIPSEEALELAKKISDVSGVLMPIEV